MKVLLGMFSLAFMKPSLCSFMSLYYAS